MFSQSLFLFLLAVASPVFSQKKVRLNSPDGNITFSFEVTKKTPVYQVTYKGKTLIARSELGLSFLDSFS